jgi:hypothetical protein
MFGVVSSLVFHVMFELVMLDVAEREFSTENHIFISLFAH